MRNHRSQRQRPYTCATLRLGAPSRPLAALHSTDGDGGSDVSFYVGGETFRAHRAILAARSPVFKAQLLGSMADAKMERITLHGVEPVAFRILLQFMYTDALPTDRELIKDLQGSSATVTDLLQHILAAADMAEAHV
jgi:speckle-type POZ protein